MIYLRCGVVFQCKIINIYSANCFFFLVFLLCVLLLLFTFKSTINTHNLLILGMYCCCRRFTLFSNKIPSFTAPTHSNKSFSLSKSHSFAFTIADYSSALAGTWRIRHIVDDRYLPADFFFSPDLFSHRAPLANNLQRIQRNK